MTKNLEIMEEYDIRELLETPELTYLLGTLAERKKVARNILSRKNEELLLINKSGFCIDSVLAGLSEQTTEYFAKHAPLGYKSAIIKNINDKETVNGVFEIAKDMDDDLGNGVTTNQQRVRNIMQYINDNRAAFQF